MSKFTYMGFLRKKGCHGFFCIVMEETTLLVGFKVPFILGCMQTPKALKSFISLLFMQSLAMLSYHRGLFETTIRRYMPHAVKQSRDTSSYLE